MNTLLPLVIQLIAGAIGGNAAGSVLKDKSLGALGNTIAGIIGGAVGGKLLTSLLGGAAAEVAGTFDVTTLIEQIVGGGAGGAIVTALVGIIKNMNKG
ncbi:MAG: hypothetical protein HYX36_17080 [Rhizobiales bacterium]|nr:hypothetical protein [Hyphomicrobiales bacterium]